MPTQKKVIYSDFNNSFSEHPVKKDLVILKNEDSVKQSIVNLVLTSYYEHYFQPNKGSAVRQSLFENANSLTEDAIKTSIEECIIQWEPRAELLDVSVALSADTNSYSANIVFRVINNNDPIELNLILKRTR